MRHRGRQRGERRGEEVREEVRRDTCVAGTKAGASALSHLTSAQKIYKLLPMRRLTDAWRSSS